MSNQAKEKWYIVKRVGSSCFWLDDGLFWTPNEAAAKRIESEAAADKLCAQLGFTGRQYAIVNATNDGEP